LETLQKFIDRGNLLSQKEAKLKLQEDKLKKAVAKISGLKKENKAIKQIGEETIIKNLATMISGGKGPVGQKNQTAGPSDAIIKLIETMSNTKGATQQGNYEVDSLNMEVNSLNIALRKREAENQLLNERILILELDLKRVKDETKQAEKENKKLNKEMKQTTKLFNEEIGELMGKMMNSSDLTELRLENKQFSIENKQLRQYVLC
jgi:hypothetical protein